MQYNLQAKGGGYAYFRAVSTLCLNVYARDIKIYIKYIQIMFIDAKLLIFSAHISRF